MALDPLVSNLVSAYLAQVDSDAPALVEGLYLVGSVAMEDFRPGGRLVRNGPSGTASSDVDFVALTSRPVSCTDLPALERVHRQVARRHRRPFFDGVYLTWADLARGPAGSGDRAYVHGGTVRRGAVDRASPVTWHELAGHGVTVRGPRASSLAIWTDKDALRRWCRWNLQDYWSSWHQRSRALLTGSGLACLTSFGPAWAVLGASRSHCTATTGQLTSKTGAGHYAHRAFDPRWHRIIDESLRIRTGSSRRPLYAEPFTRRQATLDFVKMVLQQVAPPR